VRPAERTILGRAAILVAALAAFLVGAVRADAQPRTVCYLIADAGTTNGRDGDTIEDLLTAADPDDPDPATNETSIGFTGTFSVEALAFHPSTGVLYGVDGDRLGTFDLATGAFSPRPSALGSGQGARGRRAFDNIDGLAFDPRDATLYAVQREGDDPDLLLVVDPATGAHVPGAFGPGVDYVEIAPVDGLTDIDDIAIAPDGRMLAILNENGHADRLVRIDPATGATTDIGPTGVEDMEGLGFGPDGRLFGVVGKDGAGESLWDVDPTTGRASDRRILDNGRDYEGIACAARPVPAPPPGSITIVKDARPDAATDFVFSGDLGSFSLDDDADPTLPASRTFAGLSAGHYVVREAPVPAWRLAAIVCQDPDGGTAVAVADASARVDLDPGEHVTCTFVNEQAPAVLGRTFPRPAPLPPTGGGGLAAVAWLGTGLLAVGTALRTVGAARGEDAPPGGAGTLAAVAAGGDAAPAWRAGSAGQSDRMRARDGAGCERAPGSARPPPAVGRPRPEERNGGRAAAPVPRPWAAW
jgi:hypothetical protein